LRSRNPLPFGWGPVVLALVLLSLLALKLTKNLIDEHPEGIGAWLSSVLSEPEDRPAETVRKGLATPFVMAILGDSHVAADLFSGHIRSLLQQHYGEGNGLLLPLGQPHPGIRSGAVTVQASPGWSYRTVMNAPADTRYLLSGSLAETSAPDQTLLWQTRRRPLAFGTIELVFQTGPQAGEIELALDGESVGQFDLERPVEGIVTIPLNPKAGGDGAFRSLVLTSRTARPVVLLQVLVRPLAAGISVISTGYPGATFSVLDRLETVRFDQALQQLKPDLLVLAFGTNEGFDDHLAMPRYQQLLARQINRFRTLLPLTQLVLISPPVGGRANATQDCGWLEPPKLALVRQAQDQLAQGRSLPIWSWAQIMPQSCAGHQWTLDQPRLMADDHIHLTGEGYRRSAEAFVTFVMPVIDRTIRERNDAVPKH